MVRGIDPGGNDPVGPDVPNVILEQIETAIGIAADKSGRFREDVRRAVAQAWTVWTVGERSVPVKGKRHGRDKGVLRHLKSVEGSANAFVKSWETLTAGPPTALVAGELVELWRETERAIMRRGEPAGGWGKEMARHPGLVAANVKGIAEAAARAARALEPDAPSRGRPKKSGIAGFVLALEGALRSAGVRKAVLWTDRVTGERKGHLIAVATALKPYLPRGFFPGDVADAVARGVRRG